MQKLTQAFELLLFFLFTVVLLLLFILNLPIFQDPHGLLITNELSDFSNTQLIGTVLFGSAVLCSMMGVLMVKWLPSFTAGMASNLWATTYFLLWVDSMFSLCIQLQSFRFLGLLALGLFFLYLFFFTLHHLDLKKEPAPKSKGGAGSHAKFVHYWLAGWMLFYFAVSIRLLLNSYAYPEFQLPLAVGFCALCFLNYLFFLFLQKSEGKDIGTLSGFGRYFFALWLLALLSAGIAQKWFR